MKTQSMNPLLLGFMTCALAAMALLPSKVQAADNCDSSAFVSGSSYQFGDLVSNAGGVYSCKVAGWCASTADWAYEPGVGLYWTEAWSLASQCSQGNSGDNDDGGDDSENGTGNGNDQNTGESGNGNQDNDTDEDNGESGDSTDSSDSEDNEQNGSADQSWVIDNDASQIQFITVKKEHVAEVQRFLNMSGGVDNQGKVRFQIELASVDTAITIRDERLRNFLFETDILPELQLEAQTDISQLNSMKIGDILSLTLDSKLQVHGVYQDVSAELIALKLPNHAIQVTSSKPIMINAARFAMDGGVDYLRELAGLSSIGNTVPVYLNLVLDWQQSALADVADKPATPSDLEARWLANEEQVLLSWDDNSNVETHYIVQHRLGQGFWQSEDRLNANTNSYTFTPKSSGDYSFRVFAVNTVSPSDLSAETAITVTIEGDEDSDSGDDNENGNSSYSYAADCAACHGANGEGNGGIPALTDPGYSLASLSAVISETMPFGDAASCTDDCATDIAQYILDNFVEEDTGPAIPAAASSVIAVASAAQDRIGLSWVDNSSSESGFRIYRKRDSENWTLAASVAADVVSYADTNVDIDHSYTYRVQAFNGVGEALAITSNTINLVEVVALPEVPVQVSVTRDLEALVLSWRSGGGQVDTYLVERAVNGGSWSQVASLNANQLAYEDLNIVYGDSYAYRVKAKNSAGSSAASQSASIILPENLGDQVSFESKCAGCHNPSGIGGDLLGDYIKLDWADKRYSQMVDKVLTMPASNCDDDCKEAAARYVWSDVWGYSMDEEQVSSTDRGFRTLRLLTPYEYRNSVYDLTGVWVADDDMPNPHFDDHFKYPTQADLGIMLNDEVIEYMNLAESIAAQANLSKVGCNSNGCSSAQVATMAERVLRRQLSSSELSTYQSYESSHGSRDTLASMLMSPYFLYRVELGEWNSDKAAYQLNDYEVATALSYQLFGTTPNASLLSKARAGNLGTEQAVAAEAASMMSDSRFGEHFAEFIRYYTKTYDDVAEKPGLSTSVVNAMRQEQEAAVSYLLDQGSATIDELFNPGYTFVNNTLANHYGLTSPGSNSMIKVSTNDTRGGLLHQGILHVANSDFAATSLVKRGKMIRENMMCHSMGVPSGIDPDTIDMPTNPITTRERWDVITGPDASDGQCWQCHRLMNEPGSALESFDQEGRYRTSEKAYNDSSVTLAIDAAGTLRDNTGLLDLAYYLDARGLSEELAGMNEVRECFVDSYMRYTSGHEPDSMIDSDLRTMANGFIANGNIRELAREMITAQSFLYRLDR